MKSRLALVKAGRVQAGWDSEGGGVPPSLESIGCMTQLQKDKLVDSLLGHHNFLSKDVKNILVANGIRFIYDYMDFMISDPQSPHNEDSCLEDLAAANHFLKQVRTSS